MPNDPTSQPNGMAGFGKSILLMTMPGGFIDSGRLGHCGLTGQHCSHLSSHPAALVSSLWSSLSPNMSSPCKYLGFRDFLMFSYLINHCESNDFSRYLFT